MHRSVDCTITITLTLQEMQTIREWLKVHYCDNPLMKYNETMSDLACMVNPASLSRVENEPPNEDDDDDEEPF